MSGRPTRARPDDDSVGAATRALAEATATLTRLLGKQVIGSATAEVTDTIAASLREAAKGLTTASEAVERHTAGGPEASRKAKVDRTRGELLAAAARVFAARGYEGASVGDIAAEAGYTKGALYAHFGSKSELFLALARDVVLCEIPASPGGDLVEEITGRMAATGDDTAMLLSVELLAYAVRHPESRDELAPLLTRSLEGLAARVHAHLGLPETEDLTQQDRDTALGVFAVSNVTVMLAAVTDPEGTTASGGRVLARLLSR